MLKKGVRLPEVGAFFSIFCFFDMHRINMKNSVKFLPMLLVMVALMLGSCHTKKTTTTYKPGTSRPVKIPDEWRTLDIV